MVIDDKGNKYKYELSLVYGIENGVYYIYPRFYLYGKMPYEDIRIRLIELPRNYQYSQMAVAYRNYKLSNEGCLQFLTCY